MPECREGHPAPGGPAMLGPGSGPEERVAGQQKRGRREPTLFSPLLKSTRQMCCVPGPTGRQ
eukprot:1839543-Alexandrium_andersonii.AAC.1